MAFESIKNLFGQVKSEEQQDALNLYLAKVEVAVAAINAVTTEDVHAAQLCVPMTLCPKTQAAHRAVFEAVGSMAAALEAQPRMLRMIQAQAGEVRS